MIYVHKPLAVLLAAGCLLAPVSGRASEPSLTEKMAPSLLQAEKPVEAVAASAAGPDEVDLAALYYYADQKQEERVQAEIARLQLKFPGFQAPRNLYLPLAQRSVSEQALWDLYDKNDFAGIEAETARMQAANPGWTPSADFSSKLDRRKLRVAMTEGASRKDWAAVAAAGSVLDAANEPEVDLLWTLMDAYKATGMTEALAELCKGILFREGDRRLADDLLATTLQKASGDFSAEEIRAVMKVLWPQPELVAALRPVNDDLLRKQIADFTSDEAAGEPLPAADIKRLTDLAAQAQGGADFATLGWYYLKLKQLPAAQSSFEQAFGREQTAEIVKGLYLALSRGGRDNDAYQLAVAHVDLFADDEEFLMNALSPRFSKPELGALDAATVAAYSKAIGDTQSADHAEILGWYAYNSKQFAASEAWFAKALEWEQKPARLKGLALSYLRQKKKSEFNALRAQYADQFPDIWAEIGKAVPPKGEKGIAVGQPASGNSGGYVASLKAKRYDDCIRELQRQEDRGGLSADAQLIRGWCYMGLNRATDARAAFNAALGGKGATRQDAAYGVALAALRGKLTNEAEAAISATPLTAARDREVRAEIYWQRARAAFDNKQYEQALAALNTRMQIVPESSDLSTLRAWAHQRLGQKAEAKAIFQRLSMHLNDKNVMSGLNAMQGVR